MIETKRMWEGGPLRQFSTEANRPATGKWISYDNPALNLAGYAGCYVCEGCERSVDGVYYAQGAQKWLCGACKESVRKGKAATA